MSENRKQFAYWIILFSLMTGLLFSSGEGIRLLPFPVSTESSAKSSLTFLNKNTSFYNPSTHHSGSSLLKLKTKNHKTVKLLTGEAIVFSRLSVLESFSLQVTKISGSAVFSYKSAHLVSLSDRAPPTGI